MNPELARRGGQAASRPKANAARAFAEHPARIGLRLRLRNVSAHFAVDCSASSGTGVVDAVRNVAHPSLDGPLLCSHPGLAELDVIEELDDAGSRCGAHCGRRGRPSTSNFPRFQSSSDTLVITPTNQPNDGFPSPTRSDRAGKNRREMLCTSGSLLAAIVLATPAAAEIVRPRRDDLAGALAQ